MPRMSSHARRKMRVYVDEILAEAAESGWDSQPEGRLDSPGVHTLIHEKAPSANPPR